MQLDGIGADLAGGFDLLKLGVDEQRDLDAGAPELGDERGQRGDLARDIEAAFGGDLLPPLRHQARRMRARIKRDRQHLGRHRHFEIERRELGGGQPGDVLVADVTPVLAEMRGDVVGARLDGELRRA